MKRIAVLTSGGDNPGLNPCIRAVVRMGLYMGVEVMGIRRGYAGLIDGEIDEMQARSVSGIIGTGGTILGTSRCERYMHSAGQREALRNLNETGVDALVVIGGDGSMRGAQALHEAGFPVCGVPATIENDLCGTDMAIGVDTALNTGLDILDKIKDTASSRQEAYLIEVMGARSGYLTLMTGLAGGAEMVCLPETQYTAKDVVAEVADAYVRGKRHCIVMVATGARPGASELAAYLNAHESETGFSAYLSALGPVQRGGAPLANDRFLATRLGAAAVRLLEDGQPGRMVGIVDGELISTPLAEVIDCVRGVTEEEIALAEILAR